MKRSMIAFVLFTLTLAAPISAQERTLLRRDYPLPAVPAAGIATVILEEDGYEVVFDDQVPAAAMWQGTLKAGASVLAAANAVLEPSGFEAVIAGDGKVHIRRKRTATMAAVTATAARVEAATASTYADEYTAQTRRAADNIIRREFGDVYAERYFAEEDARRAGTYRSPLARYADAYPQPYYGRYGSGGIFSPGGGYGYDGYYNPFAYRYFENQEKYGLLKIDGPDRFLRRVRVLVDGADAAVGSKANNSWNGAVVLATGPHIVEFVREDKGGLVAFKRQVNIIPMSIQRNPTWLRVSGNEFENARELYKYRQHVFTER